MPTESEPIVAIDVVDGHVVVFTPTRMIHVDDPAVAKGFLALKRAWALEDADR